jgi:hypothetical protein
MMDLTSVTTVKHINTVLKTVLSQTKVMIIKDYLNAHKNVIRNIHMKVTMLVQMLLME